MIGIPEWFAHDFIHRIIKVHLGPIVACTHTVLYVWDNDIVTTPPSMQPHSHHQARLQHQTRGDAEHLESPTPCAIRPTTNGINANASVHINPSTADPPITTATHSHPPLQPHPQSHPQNGTMKLG